MISTALNISCRIPDSISGSEKEISLSMMVPLHISISYLFCFTFYLPPFISKLIWASVEVLYIAVQKQPSFLFCKASEIIESLAGIQFYFYIFTDQILTSREMDQKVYSVLPVKIPFSLLSSSTRIS